MKRILLVLAFFAVVIGMTAQDNTKSISRNGTSAYFALDAGDTILNTNTLSKVIDLGLKQSVQLYSIHVGLDSISGTPAHTTVLAGSMDNTFYTTISTVSWAGSSADTAFVITDISTGVAWRYLRVKVTGSSTSKSQLTELNVRAFDEVK